MSQQPEDRAQEDELYRELAQSVRNHAAVREGEGEGDDAHGGASPGMNGAGEGREADDKKVTITQNDVCLAVPDTASAPPDGHPAGDSPVQAEISGDVTALLNDFHDLPSKKQFRPLQHFPKRWDDFKAVGLWCWREYVPIGGWLPTYNWRKDGVGDLVAGITTACFLVPQGMSYALVANLEPVYGLYSAMVSTIVYALLGSSRQLAVGPVAIVSILTAEAISELGIDPKLSDGNENPLYTSRAIALAFVVGIYSLGLGLFRLGFLVNFLGHPVASGFTSAGAIIIGLSQLKHVVGYQVDKGTIQKSFESIIEGAEDFSWQSFLMGVLVIFVLWLFKRNFFVKHPKFQWIRRLPSQLLVIIFATLITWAAGFQNKPAKIKIIAAVPDGIPKAQAPDIDSNVFADLAVAGGTITLIGFMESIAVAEIYATKNDYSLIPNQELIALGACNLLGSMFSCYPTAGGFGRTAVNAAAGAKTPLASLITGLVLALVLAFLTSLFYYLPKPSLGAIVIFAVVGLFDWQEMVHLWHVNKRDFCTLMATFILTLTLGVETGILIGIGISIILIIHQSAFPYTAVLGRVHKLGAPSEAPEAAEDQVYPFYRDIRRKKDIASTVPGVVVFRFDADLHFANCNFFKKRLLEEYKLAGGFTGVEATTTVPARGKEETDSPVLSVQEQENAVHTIVLEFSSVTRVDSSALAVLKKVHAYYRKRGVRLYVANAKAAARDDLQRGHVAQMYGYTHFFPSVDLAVKRALLSCGGSMSRSYEKTTPVHA
ncbi:unnamed protein product [Vitrella brassicaformis CCMP3155]|uniref:STAS domain-containing protein n=2 Tax=Vitrella brassicaformis TaxID=1169539 RepID=A0A0G4FAU4_VITBC|nr:unnamed protein product [Vitrella brassicaformis CCMP3155]|eukprot:CEM10010.1 unnamed protein product [Vitrella brassicaformis CCMP3155]